MPLTNQSGAPKKDVKIVTTPGGKTSVRVTLSRDGVTVAATETALTRKGLEGVVRSVSARAFVTLLEAERAVKE